MLILCSGRFKGLVEENGELIHGFLSILGHPHSSDDWQLFLKVHNLVVSTSRRGSCCDNVVAESFFWLLKRKRIRRKVYLDREEARRDLFDYIAMFYNPKPRHGYANDVSPVEFENQYLNRLQSV